MSNQETLYQDSISIRKLPINFNQADLALFEHELKREIPATTLLHLEEININSDGILFRGSRILPESFVTPKFWGPKAKLKFFVRLFRHILFRHIDIDRINSDVFWITDNWSQPYFHWMTDALPRLFTIREKITRATLLLPGAYQRVDYITSSLEPFFVQEVKFINGIIRYRSLRIPTHTAPTGNYNENIIRGLRSLFTDFYQSAHRYRNCAGDKIYISRGKAQKRKIVNEEDLVAILKEYGFKTVYFEDYPFEEQVKIALDAQYLISNHGAGLTNMLFMKSGSSVFELRQKGDSHNNCYFALASSLNLRYFYQTCHSENPDEDAHTANLIVDCQLLRKNIEQMLTT